MELKANVPSPLSGHPERGPGFWRPETWHDEHADDGYTTQRPEPGDPQTVTFIGRISVQGSNYSELDNCPAYFTTGGGYSERNFLA